MTESDWEIPEFQRTDFAPRKTRHCIVTACWDEGEKSYRQYSEMSGYTQNIDFIVVNRGNQLPAQGATRLKEEFNIRTLLQVDEPGQSSAYRVGLSEALKEEYDGIIMIDSNGKDGVEKIPEFVSQLDNGYDLVQGSRYLPGGEHLNTPLSRTIAVRLIGPLVLYCGTGYWYTDQANGFKGFSRKFLLDPRVQPFRSEFTAHNLQVYLNYAAAKHGFRIVQIPTRRNYPKGEVPSTLNTYAKLWAHFLDYVRTAAGSHNPISGNQNLPALREGDPGDVQNQIENLR